MKIEEIDKNFKAVERSGSVMQEITLPSDRVDLYGVYYEPSEGRFRRLPNYVAEKVNDGVKNLATNTAGGRIRFATNSSALEIEVGFNGMTRFSHMPLTGSGGVSLVEEDGEKSYFVGIFRPDWNKPTGYSGRINLRGGMRYYTLYFPLYNDVDSLTLYVDEGAELYHGLPYRDEKPILYYGSSITQGGCASRPDTCYQAHIAKWNNIDFINLGFSGSARGESAMADYLASIPCSLFVCDYDHNAPSAEHLNNTHYALYERFREAQPDTPVLFVTKPDCDYDKNADDRRKVIRASFSKAKASGDDKVYFLDGKLFYGRGDRTIYAVDGCHPTDHGFYRMAKRIYAEMIKINPKFK